jgi:hypothetical protein
MVSQTQLFILVVENQEFLAGVDSKSFKISLVKPQQLREFRFCLTTAILKDFEPSRVIREYFAIFISILD